MTKAAARWTLLGAGAVPWLAVVGFTLGGSKFYAWGFLPLLASVFIYSRLDSPVERVVGKSATKSRDFSEFTPSFIASAARAAGVNFRVALAVIYLPIGLLVAGFVFLIVQALVSFIPR